MPKELLIVYEPALFLLIALGWAGWELWSVRTRKPKAAGAPRASTAAEARDDAPDGG